jgi:nitrous oxidase accessory protein NosD
MSLLSLSMVGVRQVNASAKGLTSHVPILIDGPGNFTASNGVTGGSGAQNDPYIIQGWTIDGSAANGIEIRNIVSFSPPFFVIRNVFIHSETKTLADILVDSFASPPGCFECPGNIFNGVIANSTLTGNGEGVVLQNSDNILVSGVTVHDSQTGINCVNSDFLQIRGNRITDSGTGINVSCAVSDIFYNTILNSDNGIVVGNVGSVDIEHNYITSPQGFTLQGSGSVRVSNNRIIGSSGPTEHLYQYGISDFQTDGVNLVNNTISNSMPTNLQSGPAGINITSSGDFAVIGNTVEAGNSFGVVLHSTFEHFNFGDPFLNHNFLYHNNILNNTIQALDDSPSQNLWDNGYPSGGNFWSDFTGVDNCSGPQQNICPSPDGIGDTPYVFNFNTDHYPLMRPFQ